VPTARRSRTIAVPTQELWELVADPHHLPRWWPRVSRVEDVSEQAFTEVLMTQKGKTVRADFQFVECDERSGVLRWAQQLQGTPFAGLLSSADTAVSLKDAGDSTTTVTIELIQSLNGFFSRFGSYMVKRAAAATLDEALDGLERIVG
jgi:uncharacterized protein YndB with AHSA1/START domain